MTPLEMTPVFTPGMFLKGEVCTQFIRCNKPGCRCQTGEPHGPYYYRVWREGARVNKAYVRPLDLAGIRAACEAYQNLHHEMRALRQRREQMLHGVKKEWRRCQRLFPNL